jgi:two-component system OmpR family sensor kinase
MIRIRSIRTRLTLWYTSLLAATLLLSGVIAYYTTRQTLYENLDNSLKEEIRWLSEFIEPRARRIPLKRSTLRQQQAPRDTTQNEELDDEIWRQIYQHTLLNPNQQIIQILDRNGDLLYQSPRRGTWRLPMRNVESGAVHIESLIDEEGQELRVASTSNYYVQIFVAYPLHNLHSILDEMVSTRLYITPVIILISIIGGLILAHQSLKPVDVLTRTAREITAQNLNRRLPSPHADDEIGRLTNTLNDMIARLQASFAQVQQFSADASHELRTPLTIMRGEIELALRHQRIPKPTRELLHSLHDEAVRLSSIVENLMTLIRSESGRLVLQRESVPLDRLVRDIAVDGRLLAAKKRIAVHVERIRPVSVTGDPQRLRQLLLNIVDNAVKFTPPRGRVWLSLEQSNGRALISVRDTGVGIPNNELEKVFDRFHRVERDGRDEDQGSGLGLAIAKWIAEAHEGSITVESDERRGSTFTVILPVERPNASHPPSHTNSLP